jgi:DNA repair exonuclease SbcCD ATPase subunit|nr:MAG TPA: AAA domain protein [Caudoviricetes sp.]
MRVKQLELRNFQVIKDFDADFEGNIYFITGDNELGKSTVLKAIGALLTGERDAVLRAGEEKGFARMVVGDDNKEYEVKLTFTKANPRGTLSIKGEGVQSGNVSFLQQLFGYQNFDAVEFCNWSETAEGRRKQIDVVKSLLPKEAQERLFEIEEAVKAKKAERTDLNRDIKTFTTQVKTAKEALQVGDEKKYTERIDVTEMLQKQQERAELDAQAKVVREKLEERNKQLNEVPQDLEKVKNSYEEAVAEAKGKLEEARQAYEKALKEAGNAMNEALYIIEDKRKEAEKRKQNCEAWLAEYEKTQGNEDAASNFEAAQAHNEKVAKVEEYQKRKANLRATERKYDELGDEVSDLQKEHKGIIENANLPIKGLSFSDEGLTLNGLPFMDGVVSDSQKMEVATKLVIAANPTVKVFRIARGESLGAKRLKAILDVAKANDFQGFIENVKRGQESLQIEEYTEK